MNEINVIHVYTVFLYNETRCVCEALIPPKHPSVEKHEPDI